jgi:hypothetical protein
MRNPTIRTLARGFAIFEIMMAVCISVFLATCAMALFGTTNGSGRVMQAQAWIEQTAVKTKQSFSSSQDFMTVTQSSAVTDGLFPAASMTGDGGTPVNPWGGDFSIAALDIPQGPSMALAVVMDEVPAADCIKLATLMSKSSTVFIGGTQIAPDGVAPNVSALSVMCDSGANGARMQFDYAKR